MITATSAGRPNMTDFEKQQVRELLKRAYENGYKQAQYDVRTDEQKAQAERERFDAQRLEAMGRRGF
jgi:hypothetical protein